MAEPRLVTLPQVANQSPSVQSSDSSRDGKPVTVSSPTLKNLSKDNLKSIKIQNPASSKRGGGSGIGGGGGFVKIRDGRILAVKSVDYHELQFRPAIEEMLDDEQPYDYLRRVLEKNLYNKDAVFLRILIETLDQIEKADWKDMGRLAILSDQGSISGDWLLSDWTPIQIILRYSEFRPGYKSSVRFEYDKSLFEQLVKLDQALLILHEAIYVIASDLGHTESQEVRALAAYLLQKDEMKKYSFSFDDTDKFRKFLKMLNMDLFADRYLKEYEESPDTDLLVYKQNLYRRTLELVKSNNYRPEKYTDEEAFYVEWWWAGSAYVQKPKIWTLEQYVASPEPEPEMETNICWLLRQTKSVVHRKAQKHCVKILKK